MKTKPRIPFQVLLTAEEAELVDKTAEQKGLSRSAFLRVAALEAARKAQRYFPAPSM